MMNKYNVLWFDDEHASLEILKEKGQLNGIFLHGFDNAQDGLEELESNFNEYDAVIVDGKFFTTPDQSGDALDDQAFFKVGIALEKLSTKRNMPWFILSGQISFTREQNKYALGFKDNKVYDKANESDIESLWDDLKKEADKQIESQIRQAFCKSFEGFKKGIISSSYHHNLVEMLKCLLKEDYKKKNLNVIRDVLESVYLTFINKYKLIPKSFLKTNSKPNFAWCTRFIQGLETNDGNGASYQIKYRIPSRIKACFKYVNDIANEYSHVDENEMEKNLCISASYALVEILEWIPEFVSEDFTK